MRAYILSIGSELMLGHLTDTNATFLAQELASLGVDLLHVVQVGDDRVRIAATIRQAASDADLVICTGGIGPTGDDLTREAIADVVDETPAIDADLLATIARMFSARGQEMPERNKKQAWLIPSAEPLTNPVGTAPGWCVQHGSATIMCMPGVPREMTRMWREQVVPRLQRMLPNRVIRTTTYKTIGIGESAAEQALGDLVERANPVVATYAKDDGVHVRVTGMGATDEEATRLRDSAASEVVRILGDYVYGTNEVLLSSALLKLVSDREWTMAVIDEGGGGRFTSVLGDSPFAPSILQRALLRPRGNLTAIDLAAEATKAAPLGVGISVMVEPTATEMHEGTIEVALAGTITVTERFPIRGARPEIHRRSALLAADVLRRALIVANDRIGAGQSRAVASKSTIN
ncbi:MAG: competence/damage-inducible protein A [Thermomicrobiales bacterium]